jgi:hypothetical protein
MSAAIILGPDDLPMCPKHGIRLVTDYFETQDEVPQYELGYCPLCKKHYYFEFGED